MNSPESQVTPMTVFAPIAELSVPDTLMEGETPDQQMLKQVYFMRKQAELTCFEKYDHKSTQVIITDEGLKSSESNYNCINMARNQGTRSRKTPDIRTVRAIDRRCFNLTNLESMLTKKCTQASLKDQSV